MMFERNANEDSLGDIQHKRPPPPPKKKEPQTKEEASAQNVYNSSHRVHRPHVRRVRERLEALAAAARPDAQRAVLRTRGPLAARQHAHAVPATRREG